MSRPRWTRLLGRWALAAALLGLVGCASTPLEPASVFKALGLPQEREVDRPDPSDAAGAPAATPAVAEALVPLRPDERRTERPLTSSLLDRPVLWRLGYEASIERRNDFDLDASRDRNRRITQHEFKAEARWSPRDRWHLMAEAVLLADDRRRPATGDRDRTEAWQRGQLWLLVERPFGWQPAGWDLAVQAGRMAWVDGRAFWFDEDLDGVRLIGRRGAWRWEAGLAHELARKDSSQTGISALHRGVWRWFGQASWAFAQRQSLEAFVVHASDRSGRPAAGAVVAAADRDDEDSTLTWLGLRASGRTDAKGAVGAGKLRLMYWADAALVHGHAWQAGHAQASDGLLRAGASQRRAVRGHALDLGLHARWRGLPGSPSLLLAWALGSGPSTAADGHLGFRQTGLHENKSRLSGVKRWHRLGELLDPELSNLQVLTVGTGLRLGDRTSLELAWHRYRQAVAMADLRGSRLSASPAGLDARLGQELDLLFAWRESAHLELTLGLSRFLPGAAFDADRRTRAQQLELGAELQF